MNSESSPKDIVGQIDLLAQRINTNVDAIARLEELMRSRQRKELDLLDRLIDLEHLVETLSKQQKST